MHPSRLLNTYPCGLPRPAPDTTMPPTQLEALWQALGLPRRATASLRLVGQETEDPLASLFHIGRVAQVRTRPRSTWEAAPLKRTPSPMTDQHRRSGARCRPLRAHSSPNNALPHCHCRHQVGGPRGKPAGADSASCRSCQYSAVPRRSSYPRGISGSMTDPLPRSSTLSRPPTKRKMGTSGL